MCENSLKKGAKNIQKKKRIYIIQLLKKIGLSALYSFCSLANKIIVGPNFQPTLGISLNVDT